MTSAALSQSFWFRSGVGPCQRNKSNLFCSLYDLSLQQPGSLAAENDLRRQSSLVTDNESLWLSSCYQDAPDEVLTVNYL